MPKGTLAAGNDQTLQLADSSEDSLFSKGTSRQLRHDAILARMPLILILIILLLVFGGGGYYMGPGLGYYGGGGVSLILLIVVLYLLFGRGRRRL